MTTISNFTHIAFRDVRFPKVTGSAELKPEHALALVCSRSGVVLSSNGERISLPFTTERDSQRFYLRSHFPKFRSGLIEQINEQGRLEILFDCGEYYIDPEWILREKAHAPTEIKAVFSIEGSARFVECSNENALDHLGKVTAFKQLRFAPESQFSVHQLPENYTSEMLSQILHFEVNVEHINVSQVVALTHLAPEHRAHILSKLDLLGDAQSTEAAQIMRFFA